MKTKRIVMIAGAFLLLAVIAWSQAPQKFNYQIQIQ